MLKEKKNHILHIYLEEGIYICKEELDDDFNALDCWKTNNMKFCILSNMARDILSIPITTVASKSAFSAGGRVLDQYRSSLKPQTIEALISIRDWVYGEIGNFIIIIFFLIFLLSIYY